MKKILNHFSFFLLTIILFSSCSIQEELLFKKDFSGNYKYELDFSEMMGMMQAFGGDSTENTTLPMEEFNDPEQAKILADALGLKAANISMTQEGVLKIAFDFQNLEELNQAYSRLQGTISKAMTGNDNEGMEEMKKVETYEHFQRKGKKLTFTKPIKGMEENEDLPIDMEEMQGMLDQMENMLKAEMTISFEGRTIKKIQPSNMNVEQNENTLKIISDLNKKFSTDESIKEEVPQVIIKLK